MALASNFLPVEQEHDWQRNQHERDTSKERGSPLDAHAVEHVGGEEGEDGAETGAQKGVCGQGGGGEHEVGVYDVIEEGEEDAEDAEAGEEAGEGGHDPGDLGAFEAGPAEPEEAACEGEAADDGDGEAPFGHGDVVVGFEFAGVAWVGVGDGAEGDDFACDHAEVGEAPDAGVHAVFALKDKRVGC